jgi:hypothetical protein
MKHRQVYWGVVDINTDRIFPMQLFNSKSKADRLRMSQNDFEASLKYRHQRRYEVRRFMLEFKGTYYDIFTHEYKRINK